MSPDWVKRVLDLAGTVDEDETLEYVSLIDQAVGQCNLETIRVLLKTFVTDDDFGVQESVVSALATANPEDYRQALSEELPNMTKRAPQWAEVLLEHEKRRTQ